MKNVNIHTLQSFITEVKKEPSQAKKHKVITGNWIFKKGQPQFTSKVEYTKGSVILTTEQPAFAGGWGTGPDPIQYCLFGIAACFAVTFAAIATSDEINLTRLSVSAENWIDLRKQLGLSKDNIIEKVKIVVEAEGASPKVLKRLIKLTKERCPGTECITRSIPLHVVLKA